ncbi:hypothetical protein BH10ACI1_BH10ACI1_15320 [soil metagenome]
MKIFLMIIFGSFFVQGCTAQSELPKEMPEEISITFSENGGMLRAYKKIKIENGILEFEELKGNEQTPQKWSADVFREDLAKLYNVFVKNKFDTIKNDEREVIVYDAGSETIGISISKSKSFRVTSGENSPLSGNNLKYYQAVGKAIDDLVAECQNRKNKN